MPKKAQRKKYQKSEINIYGNNPKGVIYENRDLPSSRVREFIVFFLLGIILGLIIFMSVFLYSFEKKYQDLIYPGVKIENIDYGGYSKQEIMNYYATKNVSLKKIAFIFTWDDKLSTVSADKLKVSYDTDRIVKQAYAVGRNGNIFDKLFTRLNTAIYKKNIPESLLIKTDAVDTYLNVLAKEINFPAKDAQFVFAAGRVVTFRHESSGRKLNKEKTMQIFTQKVLTLKSIPKIPKSVVIPLIIDALNPEITTQKANTLGIKDLIGSGNSTFFHSIENRIFNIDLATSRINGILIPPNGIFSFNEAVGDISSFTGYKTAYIIKDGKTILGDGGGVCQVSTTLFRAALNAGLPIIERFAHAYRVAYYEQNSEPGIDATVFSPSNDLKFKNDTGAYILIQAVFEPKLFQLTFNFYGQKDGRVVTLTKPVVFSQSAPPPDLYQDDPNLPKDTIRQIDFSAWGAKVGFDYKVEKNGKIIFEKNFFSNYRPWQAIYLRGTKE